MFQSLRPNNQIFILHKDKPGLDVGTVVSVSLPTPKYPVPPMYGQPQEMVVDIVAKINNQDVTYQKIPANLEVADFGNNTIVISDNKEAMNLEIVSLKQKSQDIINSIDYHNNLVKEYEKILISLNPEFAEKKAQQNRIVTLENQVEEMTRSMASLMEMNKQLMARLNVGTIKTINSDESLGA